MIFVTVGTHEQPMVRLVPVLARLARENPELGPFRMQHGWTPLPEGWAGAALVERDRLLTWMDEADVVVAHVGPATVAEARALGKIPILVPRDPRAGEHVDDHQQHYGKRLAAARQVVLVPDVETLPDAVLRHAELTRDLPPPTAPDPAPAVAAFVDLVRGLLGESRTRRR